MDLSKIAAGVLVAAFVAVAAYTLLKRARKEDELLDTMCQALGLQRDNFRAVPRALDTTQVALGERQGIPVMVSFALFVGDNQDASATQVRLEWTTPLSSGVTMDRIGTLSEPVWLMKRFPALAKPPTSSETSTRLIERPWFGRCYVYGNDAELERVFNHTVRAKLDTLPRSLATVSLHDRTLIIEWFGLERDPAVVELAFRIGLECLKSLEPRW